MKHEFDDVTFHGPVCHQGGIRYISDNLEPTSTTPSVERRTRFTCVNTGAVTVTDFLNGSDGQEIVLLGDGFTTVQHGTNIFTSTAANKLLAANKVYRFTRFNNKWYEDG